VTDLRTARPADGDRVVDTIVAAFADDPAWRYFFGAAYAGSAPHLATALFGLRIGSGAVWVADDGDAVAIWVPPTGAGTTDEEAARGWAACRSAIGEEAWKRVRAYDRAVDVVRTPTPHWYLGVLAARPDRHGQGLGTMVMGEALQLADRAGVDCCLETSTADNRAFYQHRGFSEVTPVHIPDGPPTWWMRRPAADR
jgi:GNAT superfamily N-acetyltransferase